MKKKKRKKKREKRKEISLIFLPCFSIFFYKNSYKSIIFDPIIKKLTCIHGHERLLQYPQVMTRKKNGCPKGNFLNFFLKNVKFRFWPYRPKSKFQTFRDFWGPKSFGSCSYTPIGIQNWS